MACSETGHAEFFPDASPSRAYPTTLGLASIVTVDPQHFAQNKREQAKSKEVHGASAMIAFLVELDERQVHKNKKTPPQQHPANAHVALFLRSSLLHFPGQVLMGTSVFVVNALG